MNLRPRASLRRVLDDLGATLLAVVHGDVDRVGELSGIVIHDPLDEPELPEESLVLGVGLRDVEEIVSLLHSLGRHRAAALVLRAPVPEGLAEAAVSSGVAVLALTRGATWAQLAALLRSLLAEDVVGDKDGETIAGMPSGDLFALANAIAALIDAPVTIEDRGSRVLAFSGRQDEADPGRVETILGRQVPERYSRLLVERGAFRDLYRSDQPVYVEPLTEEIMPRVAIAVRAGDEVLGSIWAAVRGPLSVDRTHALCDAARLVALHMLRLRAGADVARRLRADLLSTALEGGVGAREAVDRLGLAEQPVVVLALALVEAGDDVTMASERQRLSDGLAMHLSAVHPRCAAALVGDVTYGLAPVSDSEAAVRVATDFLDRVGDRVHAVIGIGPVARGTAELAEARASADRALRVLRAGLARGRNVARLEDVHVQALMIELRDLVAARGDLPTGPVARLLAYDRHHNTNLVDTLRAWLDAFGDVVAAASSLYIHPNTFRYRLRRLSEVSGLDLTDPESRFAAMLQLRVIPPREP